MSEHKASSMNPAASPTFGQLLKDWRTTRRYTQHELADETDVSQRHLSFLESGRSMPSRDMVLHLTQTLQMPLRARNDLLVAAGYAPLYPERALGTADMTAIRHALETTLNHHEPFPALVIDRQWNVVMHNAALDKLVGLVGNPEKVWKQVDPSGDRNLMRLTLHPKGLQPLIVDWPGTATAILLRLQAEARANPKNLGLEELIADLRTLPGLPPIDQTVGAIPPVQLPVLPLQIRKKGMTLDLFSMICSFGTALDLTAEELRLELLFPSNSVTEHFLRES